MSVEKLTLTEYRLLVAYISYWCNECGTPVDEAFKHCGITRDVGSVFDELAEYGYHVVGDKLVHEWED